MWYNQGMTEKETLPLNLGLDIAACKMSCFNSFCFGRAITSHSTFPKQAPALCVTPTCLTQAGTTAAGTECAAVFTQVPQKWLLGKDRLNQQAMQWNLFSAGVVQNTCWNLPEALNRFFYIGKNYKHTKTLQFYQVLLVFSSQISECSSNSTSLRTVTLELLLFIYLFFLSFFCFRGRWVITYLVCILIFWEMLMAESAAKVPWPRELEVPF